MFALQIRVTTAHAHKQVLVRFLVHALVVIFRLPANRLRTTVPQTRVSMEEIAQTLARQHTLVHARSITAGPPVIRLTTCAQPTTAVAILWLPAPITWEPRPPVALVQQDSVAAGILPVNPTPQISSACLLWEQFLA
jgi:hypothetical protein